MNKKKTAPPLFTVQLELENSATLSAVLSTVTQNALVLTRIKIKKDQRTEKTLSLTSGTPGNLLFDDLQDAQGPISSLKVKLSNAAGNTLTLQTSHPDSPLAQRAITALSQHPSVNQNTHSDAEAPALTRFEDRTTKLLHSIMSNFSESLINHLLDLAGSSHWDGVNLYYETMNIIKHRKQTLTEDVITQIKDNFDHLSADQENKITTPNPYQEDSTRLDLVDLNQYEDNLAIDRMINIGEELHSIALESLTIRLAKLTGINPQQLQLPVHVAKLAQAFKNAITKLDIPHAIMADVFDCFVMRVIRKLDAFYADLNNWLERMGLAPNIEARIREEGSILNRPEKVQPVRPQRSDTGNNGTPAPQREPSSAPEVTAAPTKAESASDKPPANFNPDSLYQSVVAALNFRRDSVQNQSNKTAQASTDNSAGMPAETVKNSTITVANALDSLQQNSDVREALRQTHSLREYLSSNPIESLGEFSNLSAQSMNQIDLVDSLFGSIHNNVDVTKDLKPALGDLQIPLAKLALREPGFFLDREHAARGLIDKLAQVSSSANFPNRALESRIQNIVKDIVENYGSDSSVFQRAQKDAEKLVDQQENAQIRNRERVVKTQDGQEKLASARAAVNSVIHSRIRPPEAPKVLTDLIENGWHDLLVLTHIKEGGSGPNWKEHIKTLDILSLWLTELLHGEVDENLVIQRSLEAESFIDLIGQQITSALPTNVAHEAILERLRNILAGREPIETTPVVDGDYEPPTPAAETRKKIDALPRLRRWVRRVERLQPGCWLSYRDNDGKKRRMQLAWVSKDRDRYIFVNERGQKNADLSAVQLARQLSRGVKEPTPMDQLSLVDQSMYSTLEHVQKSLSFSKNHDTLTKLINRTTFENQMVRSLKHAQRKHSHHCVILMDIDQFHLVNELYDQMHGDEVISEFARLLSQLHSKKASSARLEEDLFAVLLADRTLPQAHKIAEKIRADIEQSSLEINNENITFTISAGVAPIAEYSPPVADILANAEQAVKTAKQRGRNQVVVYEEDLDRIAQYEKERDAAITDIEDTLQTDQFVLRAQPIVKTAINTADEAQHYEILLGMISSEGELESPQSFITVAERYGYMTQVDRWVVHKVFSWMNELMDAQKEVPHISINISGNSITDDGFLEYLLEQISEFGIGTRRLCFEITETGTISSMNKAIDFVTTLRDIGCKFSIDDFGTGLASHNYLRELPVDYVKIDGSFIVDIETNSADYAMARSINDLAHFLGQETVAECVESEGAIEKLKEIGIDYLQGWGVGKPRLLSEIIDELPSLEK